jgi:hypothetical protein
MPLMIGLRQETNRVIREDCPQPNLLYLNPGIITGVEEKPDGLALLVHWANDALQTGIGIPTKDIGHVLGLLGLKATAELVDAKVTLYSTGLGGVLYGIGSPKPL